MTKSTTINIGELAARLKSADLTAETFDTAIASDFEVEVEYHYTPADEEADQQAEVKIKAIKASSNVHFEGDLVSTVVRRGSDLMPLFSHHAITELTDRLLAHEKEGGDD
jgi:AAA+ superfamily predicted ATPase